MAERMNAAGKAVSFLDTRPLEAGWKGFQLVSLASTSSETSKLA